MTDAPLKADPMGCRSLLAQALADPSLESFEQGRTPDSTAGCAASMLAVALGRCRLFGVQLDEQTDGSLPLAVAVGAAQEAIRGCDNLRESARKLPDRLSRAVEIEAETICVDLLEGHLDAWAAQIALCEAYRAEEEETADAKKLAGAIEYLAGERDLADAALRSVAIELTLATSGYVLDNWRDLLAPEYAEIAPWWLVGELDELASELARREGQPWSEDGASRAVRRASALEVVPQAAGKTNNPALFGGVRSEAREAVAADDSAFTPSDERTVAYLAQHLPDILRHGGADVWFAVDSHGAISAHAYDAGVAAGYMRKLGPDAVPLLPDPSQVSRQPLAELVKWMRSTLTLRPELAHEVFVKLGWR